jgi:hypothetical protein
MNFCGSFLLRFILQRIGRAFCNDDVSNIDELPEAPVIPDFCSDRALNRCEDIFAAFVDDNCADKKDSFADSYDEYETYCEGTIDDSGMQSWCRLYLRLRLLCLGNRSV